MENSAALPVQAPTPASALRVVLDSNVWIDILVFDDPATRPIRAALEAGTLEALIDPRCLTELTRVLDYPQFVRLNVDKEAALAIVARLSTLIAPRTQEGERPLPKCRDRDDQKFLELAQASRADWLVSKDRAVLKLAKRIARDFAFRIGEPKPFVTAFEARFEAPQATSAHIASAV
ncbi:MULTISPECIES: putative toxin-antitoxin system toxin component, PIN family [unclassified Caballeronia]|uniref:putative toxin-antitoxin system toxin component, PIN family n=1 Tax=unclassified Caballeronia TaxID=2646786 RepID=UPI002028C716|nr:MULTISPECIES: putative toxin-antitoxin system toxin component, PIN family [unclassified Caballeronia]MDR5804651.1 putative toxin-antitoxin system toxin component, PIN family [Caballeronia sp. LZ001]